ncbi:hypothetical protein OSB04_029568 [Centaurea solstitialis]|uniref:Uncharacterized protein n=1 Tax=Centaurea solstitialis TaxID=347529 RepID=A0AA38S5Y6_9ASTR|nr:hypothetical protein OSB04_029568 [Centaurea solstitialis]
MIPGFRIKMAIISMGTSTCGSMELAAYSFSPRHAQHDVHLKSLSSQWQQQQRPWRFGFSCHKIRNVDASGHSLRMISNGYVGRETYRVKKDNDDKIYRRLDSCLFPEVTYSYLLGLLANEGYLIISVPYNVTFDHSRAASEVHERFNSCLNLILTAGLPNDDLLAAELVDLPLYSVGHSNGALLQVLTGSYFSDKIPKANAIISYNNRPATEAVPYFEQLGPLVSQLMPVVEASPVSSMAKGAADAWRVLLDTAEAMTPDYDPEARVSLNKFVDQLPSVFNQVAQGISEFRPTPIENREFCKNSYNVRKTLLVKFNVDAIDETDLLEETLRPRVDAIGGRLDKVSLNGNHITPCIQEPKLQVGDVYTPADAIAQGLKTLSLNETKILARTIADWFSSITE